MRYDLSADFWRKHHQQLDDVDTSRTRYCTEIGVTFVRLHVMEDAVISAMSICDRVKVANRLGEDASNWQRHLAKKATLEDSTLGSLVNILSRHDIDARDLAYLKWVKKKRDFFVHRFFRDGAWPGDLDAEDCQWMIRRLRYLQITFDRAGRRMWPILARANLMEMQDLGSAGRLMINLDLEAHIFDDGDAA